MSEEKLITVNELAGAMLDLEQEEKEILYDVMQAITISHDMCIGNEENANTVKAELEKNGITGDDHFDYWFYTILFSILAWRKGFDKATSLGYASFAGAMTYTKTTNVDEWIEFSDAIARTRSGAAMVTDFIYGFKTANDESGE